jgi:hypothetical protein
MTIDNRVQPELPVGTELISEAGRLYLNCLVCGINLGIFNEEQIGDEEEDLSDLIEDVAHTHTRSRGHMDIVRALNKAS